MSRPWDISRLFHAGAGGSPGGISAQGVARTDRRSDRRYPISADLQYRITNRRKVIESGSGRTIDISSTGILFESRLPLPRGLKIELKILWPVLTAGSPRMELHAEGRTVRAQQNCTAVQIQKYAFQSQKRTGLKNHE